MTSDRRVALVATALAALVLAAAFVALAPWYERERYERLREHEIRRHRFAIEASIARLSTAPAREAPPVLLVCTIDAFGGIEARVPGGTIDSLLERGTTIGFEGSSADFVAALGERAERHGFSRLSVLGRPLGGDGFEPAGTPPRITGFSGEGGSSWVARAAIDALEDHEGSPAPILLWIHDPELRPPVVRRARFRTHAAESERLAVDHYLGRLLAYLRARAGRFVVAVVPEGAQLVLVGERVTAGAGAGSEEIAAALVGRLAGER